MLVHVLMLKALEGSKALPNDPREKMMGTAGHVPSGLWSTSLGRNWGLAC